MQTNATLRPMGATIPRDNRKLLNAALDMIAIGARGYNFRENTAEREPTNVYTARTHQYN